MIGQSASTQLRNLHADCECEIGGGRTAVEDLMTLRKDECEVSVEGIEIALDCDLCAAFTENDTRPDIISIRRCIQEDGWLVIEMKSIMRLRAAEQAEAALQRLGTDPLFPVYLADAHVIFVIKNRRRSDNTLMRKIGTIEVGDWRIVPRLVQSGDTVRCEDSEWI